MTRGECMCPQTSSLGISQSNSFEWFGQGVFLVTPTSFPSVPSFASPPPVLLLIPLDAGEIGWQ